MASGQVFRVKYSARTYHEGALFPNSKKQIYWDMDELGYPTRKIKPWAPSGYAAMTNQVSRKLILFVMFVEGMVRGQPVPRCTMPLE